MLSDLKRKDRNNGDKSLVCNSSQNIVIAVCVSYLNRRHYAKASSVSPTLQVTVIYKDVLYCDVSDGCCHRSEPLMLF